MIYTPHTTPLASQNQVLALYVQLLSVISKLDYSEQVCRSMLHALELFPSCKGW